MNWAEIIAKVALYGAIMVTAWILMDLVAAVTALLKARARKALAEAGLADATADAIEAASEAGLQGIHEELEDLWAAIGDLDAAASKKTVH